MAQSAPEPAEAATADGGDTPEAAPLGTKHELATTAGELIQRVPVPRTLAPYVLSDDEIRRTFRLASALATSGLFKDVRQAEQAFGKILIGRDLGISPTQALQTLDIVEGAIFMRGVLLASFVRRSPDYHYKTIERTSERCRLLFLGFPQDEEEEGFVKTAGRWWEVLSEETFTIADAKQAQLVKVDKPKSGWMAHPKNMLFWRCISNAVKMEAPDLLGGVPVYTEADEIPKREALGDGQGDGEPVGLDLGPDVEAIITRATDLGHAALADRATIEMTLGDQPPSKVAEWVKAAKAELDAIPPDAEVVTGEPVSGALRPADAQATEHPPEATDAPQASSAAGEAGESAPVPDLQRIAALRRRGEGLLIDAEALQDAGDPRAPEVFEEAEAVIAQVEAMENVNQIGLGF
jgi:hypothetical protein